MSPEGAAVPPSLRRAAACLIACTLAACSTTPPPTDTRLPVSAEVPFTLRVGDDATLAPGATLEVIAVRDDSRCPQGVTCVWAGDASVDLRLTAPGATPADRVLSLREPSIDLAIPVGHRLRVVALDPAPRAGNRILPRDYRVTFVLTNSSGD